MLRGRGGPPAVGLLLAEEVPQARCFEACPAISPQLVRC